MNMRSRGTLHILLLTSAYPTVIYPVNYIFFREQAQALKNHGINVGVLTVPPLFSLNQPKRIFKNRLGLHVRNDEGIPTYRNQGINFFPFWNKGYRMIWKALALNTFQKYIKSHGIPDVLHAHCAKDGGLFGSIIKNRYGIPLVLTEHSSAFALTKVSIVEKETIKNIFDLADALIAVSPAFCKYLGNLFPTTKTKWRYIPNVVDDNFFHLESNVNPNQPQFVFLNIAHMYEKKAQKNLLYAFSKRFHGDKDVALWIGGDGLLREELELLSIKLGIQEQTTFLGLMNRDDVRNAMRDANVFVLSSHYETFGVVVAEALATGTPVIATRCGGPECIVTTNDGLLVPVNDVEALSNAMVCMRTQLNQYKTEEIRNNCRIRFGSKTISTRLEEVYNELIP